MLALTFVFLSGCSAIRVGYNQADTLLSWMAHDTFDLEPLQRDDFNARLLPLLKWHRQEQLPDYAKLLGDIKQRVQRTFTADDAAWLLDATKARYRTLAQKGAPDAAALLATFNADNIRALEKYFDKANQKFVREYRLKDTVEAQKRERLDRNLKRIREWTGPLTAEQEKRVRELNDAFPATDQQRHLDRIRRQKEFLALLNTRSNKAEFPAALRAWLLDWEKGRPADMHAAINEGYEKRIALYLEVQRMLNAQQRTHVLQKIQEYIEDIQSLTAKPAV